MTIIRRWEGIGVADATTMTTSTAGTGDDAFNTVIATPTFSTIDGGVISLSNAAEIDAVIWTGLTLTTWATHMYFKAVTSVPSAVSNFLYAMDSAGTRLWSLSFSATGQIQFRNSAATSLVNSSAIAADTWYRVTCSGTNGTSTINVSVVVASTGASFWAPAGQNMGVSTSVARFQYGRQSGTSYGMVLRIQHLAVADVTGDLAALSGTVALAGAGALTNAGTPAIASTAALSGSGALATAGTPAVTGSTVLTGSGTVTTAGTPALSATLARTGSGTVTTAGTPALAGAMTLTSPGTLALSGAPSMASNVDLFGSGTLTLSGVATLTAPPRPDGPLTLTLSTPTRGLSVTEPTRSLTVSTPTRTLTVEEP